MTITNLKAFPLNQNGYHKNMQTKERIGTLFAYPVDYTPDDCLSCDGYSLNIEDYEELYSVIGAKFNKSGDLEGTFRVPDYNITGRFLQPGADAGVLIEASLPNVTGTLTCGNTGIYGTGAFTHNGNSGNYYTPSDTAGSTGDVKFSLSDGNSIYKNSSSVQPPAQIVHICIKYR